MEYVNISGTDLRCSRIGLGCWAIGGWLWGGSDERESMGDVVQHDGAETRRINLCDSGSSHQCG